MQNNTLYIFNANTYCLNKNKLSFKENPTGYMYFSKSDTAIIFAHQEDGKLIGFIVDQNESIKKMVYSTDEDQVVNCYQIDQEERFIIKFQNITSSQQSIYLFQFQGSIAQIKSAYLEGFVLNGSAKNEEYILLFQTPLVAEPSFIELIDHNYNSVRVIIFSQYNFLYSIEQIYNFDDQNVWCKMTTDLVEETEYLIVFNKQQLTIIDQKCYEQFIPLQIMCSNNILIEQSYNIIERTHLLLQQPQQIIQKYTELIKNLEIFDEQSEIRVHLNINPKFQVYKIMKQAINIEHSLIEEIFLKMTTN